MSQATRRLRRVEHSRPILRRKLSLSSTEANRVYLRCFDIVSKNLYALDVICAELLPLEFAEEQAKMLVDKFVELRNEMHIHLDQAKVLYDVLGISEDASFSYTKEYTVEYSTHYAVQFLELIELLDTFMKMIHTVRAYGGLKATNVKSRAYERQRRLIKFSGQLRLHSQEVWDRIKKRNAYHDANNSSNETKEAVKIIEGIIQQPEISDAETEAAGAVATTAPAFSKQGST
jgi:hypothetical protein